jgi:hypothetical protein
LKLGFFEPRVGALEGRGFIFYSPRRLYLHPQKCTAWFTGSAVCDDSQFFATATQIYPNLPAGCPANLIDRRGTSLFNPFFLAILP